MVTAECPARAYLTPTRGRTSPIRTGRRRLWRPLVTAAFVIGQQSAILFQALNQQLKGDYGKICCIAYSLIRRLHRALPRLVEINETR
jgi:hypothetical protein